MFLAIIVSETEQPTNNDLITVLHLHGTLLLYAADYVSVIASIISAERAGSTWEFTLSTQNYADYTYCCFVIILDLSIKENCLLTAPV